jgi:hypothetical protein
MNVQAATQKQLFDQTLKEFVQVVLFVLLICGLLFYFLELKSKNTQVYQCKAEEVKLHLGSKSFYQDGVYFSGGGMQSNAFSKSGEFSLELTKEDAYGFEFKYPYLRGNERFRVSVWRFSNGKDSRMGILVASTANFWKAGEEVVEKSEAGWEKIQFTFDPPANLINQTLQLYCWNQGHEPIYFDDLEISIERMEPL